VGKVTLFKPQISNVKINQTTGGFTVINPKIKQGKFPKA
jgi:hypothetical protein